jgi:hypothetical protein
LEKRLKRVEEKIETLRATGVRKEVGKTDYEYENRS